MLYCQNRLKLSNQIPNQPPLNIPYERNKQKKENVAIKQILYNNKYDTRILNKIILTNDVQEPKEVTAKNKWAKFTYVRRQNKFFTQLFKNTSLKISFTPDKTLRKLIVQNKNINRNKFNKYGVYQLTCRDCNGK